jgi:hypothetical protein
MAASPRIAPQVKPTFKIRTPKLCEPKPKPKLVAPNPGVRDVLVKIFAGYEEFLGGTEA